MHTRLRFNILSGNCHLCITNEVVFFSRPNAFSRSIFATERRLQNTDIAPFDFRGEGMLRRKICSATRNHENVTNFYENATNFYENVSREL